MSTDAWQSTYEDEPHVLRNAAWLRKLAEAIAPTHELDAVILRAAARLAELHAQRLRLGR